MSEDDEDRSFRTYWHSEHYRNQVGNSLVGPVWDVLADNPGGVTVPQIRDALLQDRRVRAGQSWFISFGAEQRHRSGQPFYDRYRNMDPDAPDSDHWTWDAERRFRYALTERVHDRVRTMVTNKQALVVGPSEDVLSNSEVLQHIIGKSRQLRGKLPLYGAGEIPLITDINPVCPCGKIHHTTYKRRWVHHEGLGPDPYVLRQNWRVEVEDALMKGRIGNARELLEQALRLMPRD
jgi:hypothetical protein